MGQKALKTSEKSSLMIQHACKTEFKYSIYCYYIAIALLYVIELLTIMPTQDYQ